MSNSFPNMICNEPPPLDQSEEEDDDSEEINFSSSMKFDIDPSPMSTPRKTGENTSSPSSSIPLPILNGMSTPDILPIPIPRAGAGADADTNTNVSISTDSDNFDFTDSRTCRFESESMQESWIGNNTIPSKKAVSPMSLNAIMKTSYIGTMESEDDELETDAAPNQDPVIIPNPSGSSVQVDFGIGVVGAAIVDDFADFSQPSIPPYQPPEAGIDDTVTFQTDAINFLQAQDPLPNSESNSNSNLLDIINTTTTSTKAEGVGFDFDDFQEFQSIPSTATTTTSALPSTTENLEAQVQDDCNSLTEKIETVLEEEKLSEPMLGTADNELALSGDTTSIENSETVDPDPNSPQPATPTEELNFEDTKSSEGRDDIETESGSISHLQIESESEPSCDIDASLHVHNSGENSDIFQDADASLEIHVANNIKVEHINLEAGDFVSQTPDSFEADFGDFSAFESTPAQFEVTDNFRQNTDNDTSVSVIYPSAAHTPNVDQSSGINCNSSSTSEFLPSIESNVNANDTDEVVVQATPQSQSECEPKQTLISSKDLPLENSSSSNFHSFSDDEDDFDDFQAFKSTLIAAPVSSTTVPSAMPSCSSEPEPVQVTSSYVAPTTASAETTTTTTPTAPFQFTSTSSWNIEDTPMTFTRKGSLMEEKFENLVKSLFVLQNDSAAPDIMEGRENSEIKSSVLNPSLSMAPIDKQLKENDKNEEWNRVEDFEGSQGLLFKWPNSTAYQRLLQSLKIDNSTIVYSGKWGAIEVPRFAASLVDSPLLPVQESGSKFKDSNSPCSPDRDSETEIPVVRKNSRSESHQSVDSVTDNDCPVQHQIGPSSETTALNGSIKPLGCHLSTEAEQILNQLPDLSFMRAKTLVFPNNTINTLQTATSDHVV